MSFDAREKSRQKGKPVSLYFFRYDVAPGCWYAFTSAEVEASAYVNDDVGLVTFTPAPISRGDINSSAASDKSTLEVRTPRDIGLAAKFPLWPPSKVATLLIFDGHVGEAEAKLVWSGRVLGWKRTGTEIVYQCDDSSSSMKRAGLRVNWQLSCNWVLYDPDTCKANKAAATFNAAVTGVAAALVSISGSWDADKFARGLAEWTCEDGRIEYRGITRLDGGTLHLTGRAIDLEPGMTIRISYGCNLLYNDPLGCPLHNNKANFGGDPFIPDENPIGVTNSYD